MDAQDVKVKAERVSRAEAVALFEALDGSSTVGIYVKPLIDNRKTLKNALRAAEGKRDLLAKKWRLYANAEECEQQKQRKTDKFLRRFAKLARKSQIGDKGVEDVIFDKSQLLKALPAFFFSSDKAEVHSAWKSRSTASSDSESSDSEESEEELESEDEDDKFIASEVEYYTDEDPLDRAERIAAEKLKCAREAQKQKALLDKLVQVLKAAGVYDDERIRSAVEKEVGSPLEPTPEPKSAQPNEMKQKRKRRLVKRKRVVESDDESDDDCAIKATITVTKRKKVIDSDDEDEEEQPPKRKVVERKMVIDLTI